MVEINIYQSNDIVENYLLSWGIEDEFFISSFQHKFEGKNFSFFAIITFFEDIIVKNSKQFINSLSLERDYAIALIKLIYLDQKLFLKFNIFDLQNKQDAFIKTLFKFKDYYIFPVQNKMEMIPQSIKIFNPFSIFTSYWRKLKNHVFK